MDDDKTLKNSTEPVAPDAVGEPVVVQPMVEETASKTKNRKAKAGNSSTEGTKANADVNDANAEASEQTAKVIDLDANVSKDNIGTTEFNPEQKEAQPENGEPDSKVEESATERHIKEAIAEQAREDEQPHSSNFTLRKILGGDILTAQMLRNNIGLIVLIVGFVVVYITNRYQVQKDLIELDKMKTELDDAKYRALSSSSNLTEKSRESHVIESLSQGPDSTLKISDRPPYIIEVPDK